MRLDVQLLDRGGVLVQPRGQLVAARLAQEQRGAVLVALDRGLPGVLVREPARRLLRLLGE